MYYIEEIKKKCIILSYVWIDIGHDKWWDNICIFIIFYVIFD